MLKDPLKMTAAELLTTAKDMNAGLMAIRLADENDVTVAAVTVLTGERAPLYDEVLILMNEASTGAIESAREMLKANIALEEAAERMARIAGGK